MKLQGIYNYEITYSVRYGDTIINKRTITMKSCFSRKHALDRFNIFFYGTADELTDLYIHEIKEVE